MDLVVEFGKDSRGPELMFVYLDFLKVQMPKCQGIQKRKEENCF